MARNATQVESAERIKRRIQEAGHTYASLAAEIGITAPAIYAIVHSRVSGATGRYSLAKALGAEVSDLWPEDAEPVKAA